MCGRTGLTLCAADIQCACAYKKTNDYNYEQPQWSDEHNLGKEYNPSYNIAPTEVTPVLVSASNFGAGENDEQIIKPMMWGMVPPWHKGGYKTHGLSTNNCRLEGVRSSRLYGNALRNGNRCVIVMEGFYEWQTVNFSKQPYYIFNTQQDGLKMDDPSTWSTAKAEGNSWRGPRLLKMAGLYESWEGEEGSLYSYSIITMGANQTFGWLHHRMPAVLEGEGQVADWLDVERVSDSSAVSLLKPTTNLSWYPVSTLVNNSRNKSVECNKSIQLSDVKLAQKAKAKPKAPGSRSLMDSWLKTNPTGKYRPALETDQQMKKFKK